jgi:hypothetical protein
MNIPKTNKLSLVYGNVQSGKRKIIIDYAEECLKENIFCTVITNNFTSDLRLLEESFEKRISKDNFSALMSLTKSKDNKNIILALFNTSKLNYAYKIAIARKHNEKIETNFIFDEGDLSFNTSDSKRNIIVQDIMSSFNTVFITATPKSLFFENIGLICSNIYTIRRPKNYVSVDMLEFHNIGNDKKIIDILCSENLSKHTFYNKNGSHKIIGTCINVSRKKNDHYNILVDIQQEFKDSIILLNNDDSIKIFKGLTLVETSHKSLPTTLYSLQKKWTSEYSEYLFLIGSNKISRSTPIRAELEKEPTDCKQMLLITNMIYLPNEKITEALMVQQIRLTGLYPHKNRPRLCLYTTTFVKDASLKYNKYIEEFIDASLNNSNKLTVDTVQSVGILEYRKPYTRHKKFTKDLQVYMTENTFKEQAEEQPNQIDKNSDIANRIENWSIQDPKDSKTQLIAKFMHAIKNNDPIATRYTKDSIEEILKEISIDEASYEKSRKGFINNLIKELGTVNGKQTNGYAVFNKEKINGVAQYFMKPELIELYKQYFQELFYDCDYEIL